MTEDNMMTSDPETYREQMARIKALESENAELKAQLKEISDRHAELEKILQEEVQRIDPSLSTTS